jgi:hypothetical protein
MLWRAERTVWAERTNSSICAQSSACSARASERGRREDDGESASDSEGAGDLYLGRTIDVVFAYKTCVAVCDLDFFFHRSI